MNPAPTNRMGKLRYKLSGCLCCPPVVQRQRLPSFALMRAVPPPCGCREQDGQASGGGDSDSDKWIFNTIREKDPKKCQNGSAQPEEMETNQVRWLIKRTRTIRL